VPQYESTVRFFIIEHIVVSLVGSLWILNFYELWYEPYAAGGRVLTQIKLNG